MNDQEFEDELISTTLKLYLQTYGRQAYDALMKEFELDPDEAEKKFDTFLEQNQREVHKRLAILIAEDSI